MPRPRFLLLFAPVIFACLVSATALASTVNGRVTSVTDGHALAGATVTLGSASTTADSNGNYSFSNVAAGSYTLTGKISGFLPRSYSISVLSGATLTQNIQLSVAGILAGAVTNTSGTGIGGALVHYSGGVLNQSNTIAADSTGHFKSGWIPVGSYTVTVSATNYQGNTATATINTGQTTTITVQLAASTSGGTGSVNGTVTNISGGGIISGATLTLGNATSSSDSSGNFSFTNVAAGSYTLTATASGFLTRSYTVSVSGGGTTTQAVQLAQAGALTGTVTSATGTPITGATVQYTGGVLNQTATATTGTNGIYNVNPIAVGSYTLTVSASGFATNTASATISSGQTTTVNVTLTASTGTGPGSVSGTVTSVTDGHVISGAQLSLGGVTTTSDSTGHYAFSNVASGTYTLNAVASGFLARSYSVTVAGNAVTQAVQLSVAGKLTGTVTNSSGTVVAGATVQMVGGVLSQTFTVTANSSGVYNSGWIPVGNYTVTASASGVSGSTTATVNTGLTTTANITLGSSGGGGGGTTSTLISPTRAVVTFSASKQFTSNTSVTWSVDGIAGGNSTVGTITSSGVYTPPQTVGQHTVTATSQSNTTQSANATVWVSNSGPILTHHYDTYRKGQNTKETVLTPNNVNSAIFGKLFSYSLDGFAYAQPLYVPNLNIAGGTHNVVFIATEHDSVYAFDADHRQSSPLWHVSFLSSGVTPFPQSSTSGTAPEIGITSTPAIDLSTNLMYVVADTQVNGSGARYQLHALDISTGAEKIGPVTIAGSVPGTGAASSSGIVKFDPVKHLQRTSLLLANGAVYVAFASYGDSDPYHGWVFAYSASNLTQLGIFCDSPNGSRGGIWNGGGGLAADSSGGVYISTGNGTFTAPTGGPDYGDSLLRFSGTSLGIADWFSPFDNSILNTNDLDLGSGGPLLLPDGTGGANLIVIGGKAGDIYLVNRDNMGHFQSGSNSQIVQYIPSASPGEFFSTPAYWNGWVYLGAESDHIRAYQLQNGKLTTSPTSTTATTFAKAPSAVVSASGSSNGVAWAIESNGNNSGVLHAWDATNLSRELYNSTQAGSRDDPGSNTKFSAPVVADGKVFVGGKSSLSVYGLLP